MRTTLTIDDALADALKKLAHTSGKPFKQVVNEVLLNGLAHGQQCRPQSYRLQPVSMGESYSGVNLDKALQLADDLEDMAIMTKMELRK